ncbi:MAG: type II toxin-antitoxin system death-on-curing family toxin [Dehalococcoidia bacterium]|nr:type II toxin-antitoxin system death-on-curing family toxin [Dehalococcoidia bacterium]
MTSRPQQPPQSQPAPAFAYPDVDQTVAFHAALLERLALGEPGEVDRNRLKSTLDRAINAARDQKGDILWLASYLMFELVRGKPFAKANTQTGVALTLAFLQRNGIMVTVPDEEIAGVGVAITSGGIYVAMLEMWLRDSVRRVPQ